MPFDTIITIHIEALGHRATQDDVDAGVMVDGEPVGIGEYIPGPETDYEVWCDESGAGSIDTPSVGGLVLTSGRTFLVRWFRELALAPESFVSITDNLGQNWYSDGISVSDARQRFIVINAGRVGL